MKQDLIALPAPILVTQMGENETAKNKIIIIPHAAKEQLEGEELLDIGFVLAENEQRLPPNIDDQGLSGIQIDDEGYLIVREQGHLATLSGIANAASGNKPVLQSEGFRGNHKSGPNQEDV
jgi:hypothetical protein